jgi:hypothetical protein
VTRLDPISPAVVGHLKTKELFRFAKTNSLDVLERNLVNLMEISDDARNGTAS